MMIQFKETEVCRLIKAVQWYRDMVTGSDDQWDLYNDVLTKLHAYGEEASPEAVSCGTNDE